MSVFTVRWPSILLMLLTLVALPARGDESTASGAKSTDVQHLELGDRYEVVIRRDEVELRQSGELVQLTDEWLVLRTVSEGRSEHGVPVLSKVPYAKRLFKNVGIGRATNDCWIPRAAATVVGRSLVSDKSNFVPLSSDNPDWKQVRFVEVAENGQLSQHSGNIMVDGPVLRYTIATSREIENPWPLLGNLPGVGGMFTSQEVVFQEEDRQVPLENVMSIQVPVAAEYEQRGDGKLPNSNG